jgi:sarcosine oxidase, subunit delta
MSTARRPWHIDENTSLLLIPCPWCGPRDETEFHYGGQAHIDYPADPAQLSDDAWADFLFMRGNPRGEFRERWSHSAGCRRWFNVVRSTVTHEIREVYRIGETPQSGSVR